MDAIDHKRFLYINSANRTSGSINSFTVPVDMSANEQYDACVVTACSVPVSFLLIPNGYNTFQLKELSTIVTLTITPASYNLNSFCIELVTVLNNGSPHGWTYGASYNDGFITPLTGQINFTVTGNSGQPSFIFSPNNEVNIQCGFNTGTVTFISNALTSSNATNFINENVIYIHSSCVDNGSDNTLCDIYSSSAQQFGVVAYQCNDLIGFSKKFRSGSDNVLSFSITDENNVPLQLTQDYQFTLLVYKKNPFFDVMLKFMKYIEGTINDGN